jgi:hypothetical protein
MRAAAVWMDSRSSSRVVAPFVQPADRLGRHAQRVDVGQPDAAPAHGAHDLVDIDGLGRAVALPYPHRRLRVRLIRGGAGHGMLGGGGRPGLSGDRVAHASLLARRQTVQTDPREAEGRPMRGEAPDSRSPPRATRRTKGGEAGHHRPHGRPEPASLEAFRSTRRVDSIAPSAGRSSGSRARRPGRLSTVHRFPAPMGPVRQVEVVLADRYGAAPDSHRVPLNPGPCPEHSGHKIRRLLVYVNLDVGVRSLQSNRNHGPVQRPDSGAMPTAR